MRRVLVTGANGFIGAEVLRAAAARGWSLRAAVRRASSFAPADPSVEVVAIGNIDGETDWAPALAGVSHVIHLAAHVHAPGAPVALFRKVNVQGTEHLARAAAASGVARLVFMSSVKAHGEATLGAPFGEVMPLAPLTDYGRSKRDAELALAQVAAETGLEYTVLRPSLVYGAGAVGNYRRLMALVASGLPLPLDGLANRRSFVDVCSLAALAVLCLDHPAARNEAFLAADAAPLSTTDLLRLMASGLGVAPHLFSMPQGVLRLAARLIGRQDDAERLLSSLEVDAAKARRLLDWRQPSSSEQGIIDMARDFAAQRRSRA